MTSPTFEWPTNLAKGQETAQWVLDTIRRFPEQHDQGGWSYIEEGVPRETPEGKPNYCGTTHCAGGWTVAAHYGGSTYDGAKQHNRSGSVSIAAADLLGIQYNPLSNDPTEDAYRLFYGTTEGEAVRALEYLAQGQQIDWREIFAERAQEFMDEDEWGIFPAYMRGLGFDAETRWQ